MTKTSIGWKVVWRIGVDWLSASNVVSPLQSPPPSPSPGRTASMNSEESNETAASPLIKLEGLTKSFGRVRALSDVTLEIPNGPVGLLGPNGAGKTTLLKILLGLSAPTSGKATIGGFDPSRKQDRVDLRRRIGYMPESDCLVPNLNAVELVALLGRLSGLQAHEAMTRAHEVLDYVGLDEERYRDNEGFSTGMKQRLKLAQALVHDPDILLLDEPTNGLDPRGRTEMLDLIRELGGELGKSILLCSHLLPDVENTCEHVVVLREGKVQLRGRISELTSSQNNTVTIRISGSRNSFAKQLTQTGYRAELVGSDEVRLGLPSDQFQIDDLFKLASQNACTITSVQPVRSSLEEVFLASISSPRGV